MELVDFGWVLVGTWGGMGPSLSPMNTTRTALLYAAHACLLTASLAVASEPGEGLSASAGLVIVPAAVSAQLQNAQGGQATGGQTTAGQTSGGQVSGATPSAGTNTAPVEAAKDELVTDSAGIKYGTEGTTWWAITGGIGADFIDSTDYNIAGSISHFVVNNLEVGGELGIWYHNQPEPADDVGSANLVLTFRWHFLNRDTWTIFADAGIGMYFASDELPEGGTEVGFTPRLGVGFTHQLGDSQNRLIMGVRWAHFSNARISGDDENPGIDDAFFYGGLLFPF